MENRPQHPIGEAVVIFLIVGLDEVGHGIGHATVLNGLGRNILVARNRSAPAEPESLVPLEERAHGNGQPTGQIAAIAAWDGHAVRHYDQPRQYRSSQLRESRIAAKIRPAIE